MENTYIHSNNKGIFKLYREFTDGYALFFKVLDFCDEEILKEDGGLIRYKWSDMSRRVV